MALYRYFFKVEKGGLPDSHGPLATVHHHLDCCIGFQAARKSTSLASDRKKGGPYAKYTPKQKALIAKREADHGVVASSYRFYQGRIEPPEAARGHATSVVGSVDSEM